MKIVAQKMLLKITIFVTSQILQYKLSRNSELLIIFVLRRILGKNVLFSNISLFKKSNMDEILNKFHF